jgi:hypothetical protein
MEKGRKSRAFNPRYESPSQLVLPGFETPFERELDGSNRWVVLSRLIPWDDICNVYRRHVPSADTGREPLSPRIIIGSLIIKYICKLDDRETVDQISENVYMQYFLGYPSFTGEKPFDASLFVDIRKRLGLEAINEINERVVSLRTSFDRGKEPGDDVPGADADGEASGDSSSDKSVPAEDSTHKGRVLFDATACPQDIAYPTDLDLLSEAREITERLVDRLHDPGLHGKKPRTYRRVARKRYLEVAQKKKKSKKSLRAAIRRQLGYAARNVRSIDKLLDAYERIPLDRKEMKQLFVIRTLLDQQLHMYKNRVHTVEHRIVSIHQPHIRPIVRGKSRQQVEFGSKIHVSVIDGIGFLDELSWDAFNEGRHLEAYVEKYRRRFGFYPREVLADQIYCTRENRRLLKEKGIKLLAKPLGRPSAVQIHVSPGERNPIEGKFGQAKTGYGLNRIRARLRNTSEAWIAGIFLVLNLVKLAGAALPCLVAQWLSRFSAWMSKFAAEFLENTLLSAWQAVF